MRVLILTCNTGGGHNAVAAALRDSLQRCRRVLRRDGRLGLHLQKGIQIRFQVAHPVLPPVSQALQGGLYVRRGRQGDGPARRPGVPLHCPRCPPSGPHAAKRRLRCRCLCPRDPRHDDDGAEAGVERLSGVLLRGHGLYLQPHGGCLYPGYLRHSPSGAGRRVRQLRHRPRYPPARRHPRAFRLPPAR